MSEPLKTLLVTLVGGSPGGVVAGVIHCRPERVLFVCSPETRSSVTEGGNGGEPSILARLRGNHFELPAGAYDVIEIDDAQDLESFVTKMRKVVEPEVRKWLRRGDGYKVCADFTGGTKCMSAGLVLASLDWNCEWQYVGGRERTKGGVGVVVDGSENIVHPKNPWDTLAWRHVLRAAALFDQGDTGAATAVVHEAVKTAPDGAVKGALSALLQFCSIYREWDAFRHREALKNEENFQKNRFAMMRLLSDQSVELLAKRADADRQILSQLADATGPTGPWIADVFSNGERRMKERRWDDAAARFYRCIEALAQQRLVQLGIDSSGVPVEKIPVNLRAEWCLKQGETFKLSLVQCYKLLEALGDELGARASQSPLLNPKKSPLQIRNQSILAHGFQAVSEAAANSLRQEFLNLAPEDISTWAVAFPSLSQMIGLR